MNRVILIGRLVRDPEVRSVASGQAMARFAPAVDRGRGQRPRFELLVGDVLELMHDFSVMFDRLRRSSMSAVEYVLGRHQPGHPLASFDDPLYGVQAGGLQVLQALSVGWQSTAAPGLVPLIRQMAEDRRKELDSPSG